MYRPRQYVVDAKDELCRTIRAFPFATIAVAVGGRVELAYAPIVLDETNVAVGRMRFHLARANHVANLLDGNELVLSFRGPDGYVSPDWYASEAMVPTWNYIAVEARGRVARLEESQLRCSPTFLHRKKRSSRPKRPGRSIRSRYPGCKRSSGLSSGSAFDLSLWRASSSSPRRRGERTSTVPCMVWKPAAMQVRRRLRQRCAERNDSRQC